MIRTIAITERDLRHSSIFLQVMVRNTGKFNHHNKSINLGQALSLKMRPKILRIIHEHFS
jgi:hypothetical protein